MESYIIQLQKLWQNRTARVVLLLIAGIFAIVILQNSAIGSWSVSPVSILQSPPALTNSSRDATLALPPIGNSSSTNNSEINRGGDLDSDPDLGEDHANPDEEFKIDLGNGTVLKKTKDGHFSIEKINGGQQPLATNSSDKFVFLAKNVTNSSLNSDGTNGSFNSSVYEIPPLQSAPPPVLPNVTAHKKPSKPKVEVKAFKTYYIPDMEQLLIQNRESPQSTKPLWPSPVDREILEAREQIENAPILTNDPDLYAPVFRNLSQFKRSYELMEQILKVYVYKEGDRPIFHKPFFTGLYASEGWFMKQMEENKQYGVDDPAKAHLFYMPFSSRILEAVLYVENSHTYKNMIQYLRNYIITISTKYPFWNRTGGADHFLAGCHDWTTRETAASMETSIRALCNADVHEGFEIGKDVSLPETNIPNGNDPLHGLGGKPPRKRTLLAFFAGQMHGYLRPILLQYWENKDPAMKIIGKMPHYGKTIVKKKRKKITINMYYDYMKDSKYCICPRGYEVNSPRIIEAIFYECVPVIISDNFVPPFFEILKWEAFSLILPESDVPRLKEILLSIPRKKYEALQLGVRRVQKHFLWNKEPIKYDLFHMILHNVWLNRVYQLRVD